jgi:hypothetical protein
MIRPGWVSLQAPMVDATGKVPASVLLALNGLGGRSSSDCARRSQVREFLEATCRELAESRAQVVGDRAELDRLRGLAAARATAARDASVRGVA